MIKWLYNNYALTGAICLYYMALIGYGTYHVFDELAAITGAVATAYATLMGLPAAMAALLKWRFSKDNE